MYFRFWKPWQYTLIAVSIIASLVLEIFFLKTHTQLQLKINGKTTQLQCSHYLNSSPVLIACHAVYFIHDESMFRAYWMGCSAWPVLRSYGMGQKENCSNAVILFKKHVKYFKPKCKRHKHMQMKRNSTPHVSPPQVSLYILKTWVQKNTQLGFISQYILVICSLSVDIQHLIF